MGKKLVNIFLVLVLSIQMLPVEQMGRALFNNFFNEEIPHAVDFEKDCCKKEIGKSEFIDWTNDAMPMSSSTEMVQLSFEDATMPHNHSIEILVPPPNC